MKKICLIDGSGYIFRAYYAIPTMTDSKSTPVNAVYGFTSMMMNFLQSHPEFDYAIVLFDAKRVNFRNDIYGEYKANRDETPEDLKPQFPIIREAVTALNIPYLEMEGFEADDLIATMSKQARQADMEVTVVSADKDLMQLVGDGVKLYDPMKNKNMDEAAVLEKFGVTPNKVIEVQALAGDSSDNIPGVPGIGVKTAAQLINEFGDIHNLLARADEIKQNKRREKLIAHTEDALISLKLVTLKDDIELPNSIESYKREKPIAEKLKKFIEQYDFKSLKNRAENWILSEYGGVDYFEDQSPKKKEKNYKLITELKDLQKIVNKAKNISHIAIDTETDSLDAMTANMVGFSISMDEYEAFYIPIRHYSDEAETGTTADLFAEPVTTKKSIKQVDIKEALQTLKPILECKSLLKIGHNMKYDIHIFQNEYQKLGEEVNIFPIADTLIMSYVLDGVKNGHSMDELAKLHLDYDTVKYSEICGTGKNQKPFASIDIAKAYDYASEDADITLRLYNYFKQRLIDERQVEIYEKYDNPLVSILNMIERNGVQVDSIKLKSLSQEFSAQINTLEHEIHVLAGKEFNIASPKQLGEILFDDLGLTGGKKTSSGSWKTSVEVLEKLAADGEKIAEKIIEHRHFSKLKSTYTDSLVSFINKDTKRVHSSFMQTGTLTGRLSSNNPNIQNIPIRDIEGQKIRECFIAPKGKKIIAADYSQVELRLMAHTAKVEALITAFNNEADIHSLTASQVFNVPLDKVDKDLRRRAKAINFGIIYGMSKYGLAKQLDVTDVEADNYINSYFTRFPEIKNFMEQTENEAKLNGFVTTPFGRKIYITGINDKNGRVRSYALRSAINAPIQGGAADIIKLAMKKITDAIKSGEIKAKLIMQIHDELVFEVDANQAQEVQEKVKDIMQNAVSLTIPLTVDANIGDNWGEAH